MLLFTPNEAKRPIHSVMTVPEVVLCLNTLHGRERLIAKLAILAGMRPGEIFGLTWGRLVKAAAEVTQRVYRGKIDTPKTHQSLRKAALSDQLVIDVEEYRKAVGASAESFVFASERGTALRKDNVWRRNMEPALAKVGLGWVNFQVMRRRTRTPNEAVESRPARRGGPAWPHG